MTRTAIGTGIQFGVLIYRYVSVLEPLIEYPTGWPDRTAVRVPVCAGSNKLPYKRIKMNMDVDLELPSQGGAVCDLVPGGSTLVLPCDQADTLTSQGTNGTDFVATYIEDADPPTPPTTTYPVHILGTVGGEPVTVTPGVSLNPAATQTVTIGGTDYIMSAPPPGWPGRPPPGIVYSYPRTITAGTTVEFLQPEAQALINAGFAS